MQPTDQSKMVGVFDSGVGGLSVLQAIRTLIPAQPLIYFADQAHVPYGSRTLEEVCRNFPKMSADFLISQGARVIVVACNTASAAALHSLRAKYPEVPFVGMEPAVKPAAETNPIRCGGGAGNASHLPGRVVCVGDGTLLQGSHRPQGHLPRAGSPN